MNVTSHRLQLVNEDKNICWQNYSDLMCLGVYSRVSVLKC